MEALLNRRLNFVTTRNLKEQEYWSNYSQGDYNPPIFKKKKTNLPTKHPNPQGLNMFLNAVKSEISDSKGLNKTRPNLPPEEQIALHS